MKSACRILVKRERNNVFVEGGGAFRIKRFCSPHTALVCWSQTEAHCGRLSASDERFIVTHSPVPVKTGMAQSVL